MLVIVMFTAWLYPTGFLWIPELSVKGSFAGRAAGTGSTEAP